MVSAAKDLQKLAVVVGLVVGGGMASAETPRRAVQTRTTPVTLKAPPTARAPKAVTPRKLAAAARPAPAPAAPTATAVMVSYQRVGRDIIQLQNLRGTECTLELWQLFRSIKLDTATATSEARIETAALLQELQQRIERKRGVTLRQECLDNPLAAECQ